MIGFVNTSAGLKQNYATDLITWAQGVKFQATSALGSGVGKKIYTYTKPHIPKGFYLVMIDASVGDPTEGWWQFERDGPLFNYTTFQATKGIINVPIAPTGDRYAGWGGLRWGCLLDVLENDTTIACNMQIGHALVTDVRYYSARVYIQKLSE